MTGTADRLSPSMTMAYAPTGSASLAGFRVAAYPEGDASIAPRSGMDAAGTATARRKLVLVLVQPGPESGWRVLLPGKTSPQQFLDRSPALNYAKAWASANRPSTMRVSGVGDFLQEWSFR